MICDAQGVADNIACLKAPCINANQRLAVEIVLMNYIAAALATRQDIYTKDELTDLGKCFKCFDPEQLAAARTFSLWQMAELLSQSAPTTVAGLTNEAQCLACDPGQLKAIWQAMFCEMLEAAYDAQVELV